MANKQKRGVNWNSEFKTEFVICKKASLQFNLNLNMRPAAIGFWRIQANILKSEKIIHLLAFSGSSSRTRTYDPAVNSRMLYRLSY